MLEKVTTPNISAAKNFGENTSRNLFRRNFSPPKIFPPKIFPPKFFVFNVYEFGGPRLNQHMCQSSIKHRKLTGLLFLLNGRINKVHFSLMVKLEHLHVKNRWG